MQETGSRDMLTSTVPVWNVVLSRFESTIRPIVGIAASACSLGRLADRSRNTREETGTLDTYNIYMDELPAGEEIDGEEIVEVEFRVVPGSTDDGEPETSAVIAGLDLVDLINLRDALQQEIDNYALTALEANASRFAENELG